MKNYRAFVLAFAVIMTFTAIGYPTESESANYEYILETLKDKNAPPPRR